MTLATLGGGSPMLRSTYHLAGLHKTWIIIGPTRSSCKCSDVLHK